MTSKVEDDYWNQSSVAIFEFGDEQPYGTSDLLKEDNDAIFSSASEVSSDLPLLSIITKNNLSLVLADTEVILETLPPIEEVINDLFNGKSCNLYKFCKLSDKISLLDKAIETYDGNVILKVILFLNKTLKTSILFRILKDRPIAAHQYSTYLSTFNKIQELELFYTATVNTTNISKIFYLSSQNTSMSNTENKLNKFFVEYLNMLKSGDYEKNILTSYKTFIENREKYNLNALTPTAALSEFYNKLLSTNSNLKDPRITEFVKDMKISNFQNEWILINAIAKNEKWEKIKEVLTKTNWFTKKNSIKLNINLEYVIINLYKHNASKELLETLLRDLGDIETGLDLGKKVKCHRYVIDTLVLRKDKLRLMDYKDVVSSDPELVQLIENASNLMI